MNELRQAIILAAGRSRRMESLSFRNPKCLFLYQNEIILARLVRQLRENGIEKIVIAVGYRAEAIRRLFENQPDIVTVENKWYEEDVNIYSMKLALEQVSGACAVFEADTVMEDALVKYVVGDDFEGKSVWFTRGRFTSSQYGGILKSDGKGTIKNIRIVPAFSFEYRNYRKLTGIMRIGSRELEIFRNYVDEYVKNSIKQYYLIPWIDHLAQLPCMEGNAENYIFFTFNKPEEYMQLQNVVIDTLPAAPEVISATVASLRGIEEFDEERVKLLTEKIRNDGCWTVPIMIEKKNNLVLDGQHRLEAAKRLGLSRIPAIPVDYSDVMVWTLRKEEKVSPKLVTKRALSGDIYPYKTVKHKFPFRIPLLAGLKLSSLADPEK